MPARANAKPEGQNGFKLSVFSYDPKRDYGEIVKESHGGVCFRPHRQRVSYCSTDHDIEHGGGERFEVGPKLTACWWTGSMAG